MTNTNQSNTTILFEKNNNITTTSSSETAKTNNPDTKEAFKTLISFWDTLYYVNSELSRISYKLNKLYIENFLIKEDNYV